MDERLTRLKLECQKTEKKGNPHKKKKGRRRRKENQRREDRRRSRGY